MTIADLVAEAAGELDHHVSSSADECLKCNVCNTVCPVMRVTDLFPGPKYEGPQAQRFRLARGQQTQGPFSTLVPSPDHSVDYCSGCG
jgi:glycerol-3-phosphate dehydrogenase subunit C